ncbi:MAG: hypothetical protein AAGA70_12015 [Pseudomonadota bacterium]
MLRQDFAIYYAETQNGVRVEIGASLLLLALVMIPLLGGAAAFLHGVAVFLIVLAALHLREVARSILAGRLGLRLDGVVLSGAGGRTLTERRSCEYDELIAISGPLASFSLWALANLALTIVPDGEARYWLEIFAFVNLFVGLFTILPVQSLDGGRFCYLWLRRRVGAAIANRLMGAVGLLLAVIWLPASLLAFLICGIVLIALPSIGEHWAMLKGADAIED